jgi:SAM-dependent methyltransferase
MSDEPKRTNRSSLLAPRSSFAPEAYGSFAYAYDQALGRRFFRAVRELLRRSLDRYRGRERTHLDLACGTALAVEFFTERGYRSVGVDLSLPMLRIGRARAKHIFAGDMRALPLRGRFGWVTCLYDSLNHLKSGSDLVAAFRSVASVMAEKGLFLFDVNHPDIYPAIWGNDQPFVAEGEGFHLEMATKFRARDGMAQALVTGWADVAGTRVKIHERREQRAYSEREIIEALTTAGLVPIEVTEFDPFAEGRNVKLFFVCRHV